MTSTEPATVAATHCKLCGWHSSRCHALPGRSTCCVQCEHGPRPEPTAADVKLAQAVGFIESAQDQAARARRAVIAAGEDATGLERILRDLNRELVWLRG